MQCIKESAVAAVPLAQPLNLPMIKPKEQFTICTYMYTQYRSVEHVRECLYPMGGYVAGQNWIIGEDVLTQLIINSLGI